MLLNSSLCGLFHRQMYYHIKRCHKNMDGYFFLYRVWLVFFETLIFLNLFVFLPWRVIQFYQHFTVYQDMIRHFNGKIIIIGKMLNTRCWSAHSIQNIHTCKYMNNLLLLRDFKTTICVWLSHFPNKYLHDIFIFTEEGRLEEVDQIRQRFSGSVTDNKKIFTLKKL